MSRGVSEENSPRLKCAICETERRFVNRIHGDFLTETKARSRAHFQTFGETPWQELKCSVFWKKVEQNPQTRLGCVVVQCFFFLTITSPSCLVVCEKCHTDRLREWARGQTDLRGRVTVPPHRTKYLTSNLADWQQHQITGLKRSVSVGTEKTLSDEQVCETPGVVFPSRALGLSLCRALARAAGVAHQGG